MGQYYKAVLMDKDGDVKAVIDPECYGEGVKLMDHAYLGQPTARSAAALLRHSKRRVDERLS